MDQTQNSTPTQATGNWSKGCLIIAAPFISIIVILIAYAIVAFIADAMIVASDGGGWITILRIVNVALGFMGILAIIGIPVCLIIGVIVGTSAKK